MLLFDCKSLSNGQISAADVTQIETEFDTSFSAIQAAIRDVERVIRETGKTLARIIDDLDNSNWNNLRSQERKLAGEIADIDALYAKAVEDINASNAALEADLNNVLVGQVRAK